MHGWMHTCRQYMHVHAVHACTCMCMQLDGIRSLFSARRSGVGQLYHVLSYEGTHHEARSLYAYQIQFPTSFHDPMHDGVLEHTYRNPP